MTDVAQLGYAINSRQAVDAGRNLDAMAAATRRAETSTHGVTSATDAAGRSVMGMSSHLIAAARNMLAFGAAAFGVRAILSTLGSFEASMAAVAAVTRATAGELAAMRDVAKELGATTEFTASQAAEGLRFLGMAGFSAAEAVAAIPDVLNLATAGALGLAEAADIASNIMSGFGIAATDAGRVTDVMAAVAARANTNIIQLGDAMKYVAPIAAGLSVSIEETAAAIGVMSDAGLQGSMAGTGLRMIIAGLISPTNEAALALARFGLTTEMVNPATHTLAEIMTTMVDAGIDASSIFGILEARAATAWVTLSAGIPKLRQLTLTLQGAEGEAARMAGTMRDQLRGDFQALASAAESVIIAIGESGLTAVLRGLSQTGATALRTLADHIEIVVVAATALAVRFVALPIAGLIAGFGRAAAAVAVYDIATRRLVVSLTAANAASIVLNRTLALFGGPIGLAVTAIAAGLLLWSTNMSRATRQAEQHAAAIQTVRDAYEAAGRQATALTQEQAQRLALGMWEDLRELSDEIVDAAQRIEINGARLIQGGRASVAAIAKRILDIQPVLLSAAAAGDEAAAAALRMLDPLLANIEAAEDLAAQMEAVQAVATGAAASVAAAGNAAGTSGNGWQRAADAVDEYRRSLEMLNGIGLPSLTDPQRILDAVQREFNAQGMQAGGSAAGAAFLSAPSLQTAAALRDRLLQAIEIAPDDAGLREMLVLVDAAVGAYGRLAERAEEAAVAALQAFGDDARRSAMDAETLALYNQEQAYQALTAQMEAAGLGQDAFADAAAANAIAVAAIRAEFAQTIPVVEKFAEEMAKALNPDTEKIIDAASAAIDRVADAMSRAQSITKDFFGGLVNDLLEGKSLVEALGNAFKRLGQMLIDAAMEALANWAVKQLFGLLPNLFGGGGLGGGAIGSVKIGAVGAVVKHSGGVIGAANDNAMRWVHSDVFAAARRYHSGGLAGDEVPAILQRGERVLSRAENAAYERGGSGVTVNFGNVTINGTNLSPEQLERILRQRDERNMRALEARLPGMIGKARVDRRRGVA